MKPILVLVIIYAFLLAACDEYQAPHVNTHKNIGILLFGNSRVPQSKGLIDGLKTFGYEEGKNLTVTILNAENNKSRLNELAQQLLKNSPDILVAGGGLEAEAIKSIAQNSPIPTLVLYINAIIERHFINDRRSPGWGVTGVDNLNFELTGKRIEILHDFIPEAKKILILYYPDIKPSSLGVQVARDQARKLGLTIDARAVNSRDDIKKVMDDLKPREVDAMLTVPAAPIDNAIKALILPNVQRLSLPLFTHSRKMVQAGALGCYGAPFYDLGKQAARLADKIFKGGKANTIPFETPTKFLLSVNSDTMKRLGIKLSNMAASQVNEYIQ